MIVTRKLNIETKTSTDEMYMSVINITPLIQKQASEGYIGNGIVTIFIPATTASIATIEFEEGLISDFQKMSDRFETGYCNISALKKTADQLVLIKKYDAFGCVPFKINATAADFTLEMFQQFPHIQIVDIQVFKHGLLFWDDNHFKSSSQNSWTIPGTPQLVSRSGGRFPKAILSAWKKCVPNGR